MNVVGRLGPRRGTALLRAAIGGKAYAQQQFASQPKPASAPEAAADPREGMSGVESALVRAGLRIGEAALAQRLPRGLQARNAYAKHALVAANAALTEARGDLQAAADCYLDAADRWERFGVVPEQAFALLGRGRCLLGLSQPTEATPVLRHAREIFARLRAAPALAEADSLLERSPGATTRP